MDVVIGKDEFSKNLADAIQAKFIKYDTSVFPDGEIKPKLETEKVIEGKKVLIVSRTERMEPSINNTILEIFFIASLVKELRASEINLFIPYMFYSRQDKRFLAGEPKSLLSMAEMYEGLGIKNLFTINSHLFGKEKDSLQDFFNHTKVHDISPAQLLSEYLKTKQFEDPIVIGPDKGTEKMIKELSNLIGGSFEFLQKQRYHTTGEITIQLPSKELKDRDVIIYDDVVASGGTISKTFDLVKEKKPRKIYIALPHILTKRGIDKLKSLDCEIITTDSFISEKKIFTELSLIPLVSKYLKKSFL
jgi:ribose-phosphate pyrophosphokinase